MGGEEEEATPKGNDVFVELEVSLRDLYLGNHFEVCGDCHLETPRSMLNAQPGTRRKGQRAQYFAPTTILRPALSWK